MVVTMLSTVVGTVWSFALVGAFLLVLMAIIWAFRRRLVYAPMVRFLARLFLDEGSSSDKKSEA